MSGFLFFMGLLFFIAGIVILSIYDPIDVITYVGIVAAVAGFVLCLGSMFLMQKDYYEQRIPNLEQQMREYEKEQLRDRLEELENIEIEED